MNDVAAPADATTRHAWAMDVVRSQCRQAGVREPTLVVRDDIAHPDAWVVSHAGQVELHLSAPFLLLPEQQVHAVVAHEVAHLRMGHPQHWASGPAADLLPDLVPALILSGVVIGWFSPALGAVVMTAAAGVAALLWRIRVRYRGEELAADLVAAQNGHAAGLCAYFATIARMDRGGDVDASDTRWSWWLRPWRTHPDTATRQLLLAPWLPMANPTGAPAPAAGGRDRGADRPEAVALR